MEELISNLEKSASKIDSLKAMFFALENLLIDEDNDKAIDFTYCLKDLFAQYSAELSENVGKIYSANNKKCA